MWRVSRRILLSMPNIDLKDFTFFRMWPRQLLKKKEGLRNPDTRKSGF